MILGGRERPQKTLRKREKESEIFGGPAEGGQAEELKIKQKTKIFTKQKNIVKNFKKIKNDGKNRGVSEGSYLLGLGWT